MSWTFNPPPEWPLAPGWEPPPGWSPDPSWPPAPEGWQFWVAAGESGSPPGAAAGNTSQLPAAPSAAAGNTGPVPAGPGAAPAAPVPATDGVPWHGRWWAAAAAMLLMLLVGCVLGGVVALLGK